jgi:hypothetical protein
LTWGFYDEGPLPSFARWGIQYVVVPDDVRKCVAFIGTMQGDRFRPSATAFFVSYEEFDLRFMYLVTADHVVAQMLAGDMPIYCRINLVNGDVACVPVPNGAWKFYPDERHPSDVAVCPIGEFATADDGETVAFDCKTICLKGRNSIAALESVFAERGIGVGDEIFITGLFRSHFGHERNIPIVRVGNIAMLKSEPILTNHPAGYIEAHLIEARSIGGLSGSPVFVHLPPFRITEGIVHLHEIGTHIYYLLGLVHGHFDVRNLRDDSVVEDAAAAGGINTGIGVVIPVEKIIETIEQPDFARMRSDEAIRVRQKSGATPDD